MALSYRPALKCARAMPALKYQALGSVGLRRIARSKIGNAASGSPRARTFHPAWLQANAELGLSVQARSISNAPTSRSAATQVSTQPAHISASASSEPFVAARRASRMPSAISVADGGLSTLRRYTHIAAHPKAAA